MNLRTKIAIVGLAALVSTAGYVEYKYSRGPTWEARSEAVRKNLLSSQSLGPIHSDSPESQELKTGEINYLHHKNYEATIKSKKNIVVILTSVTSCPPCNLYHQDLEDDISSFAPPELQEVNFLFIERGIDPPVFNEISSKVNGIPTTFIYQEGKLKDIIDGYQPKIIKEKIRKYFTP